MEFGKVDFEFNSAEVVKMETLFGFILFAGLAAGAFFYLKGKKNNVATGVNVAAPEPAKKEEEGVYLGAGNPTANGPRPLWKLSHEGEYYGNGVEVWFDGKLAFTVVNGAKRQDQPDGSLWKPVSDVQPRGCAIHAAGGSKATKCVVKYKG